MELGGRGAGSFAAGSLVHARGREWVVLAESEPDLLVLRPLGGGDDDTAAVLPNLEPVRPATFPPPTAADLGDAASARLLRTALRIGFRSSAGPFRSLANLAVEPRAYQFVPLLLALRQGPVRMLIADDVGIGKTVEAGLIAAELLAQGDARRLAVLCSPALAEQWQGELRDKFAIDAELVLPATAARLSRRLMLNQSLFDRYPHVVISTDFIKSPARRHEFVNHCPELVIVDEAHTAVAEGSGGGARARTQRHELLKALAADATRHLVLVTATPHSGKEEGFRNLLALLDPELATVDLDDPRGRARLARHFVQRRRADIRHYLDEDTAFPSDRLSREAPYELSAPYAAFFDRVLAYAREQVVDATDPSGPTVRQRVRWWSALALLRTLASSPAAAAATLRTRASAAQAESVEEADALGRAVVLDSADDEALESLDVTPGADAVGTVEDEGIDEGSTAAEVAAAGQPVLGEKRRLLALARDAAQLTGPRFDRKLATLVDELKGLLADGYDPIVFCRFIDTAEYVAAHLGEPRVLGAEVNVAAVTGRLPPELRQERIAELCTLAGRHVLVATDCLSEGVNLQEHFGAVVHYDLAWNPTRHEQREGRVDRFGQRRDVVRAVTIYGRDNRIDGIVLDVLIRKHRAIRAATGVSVPVPDESDGVVEALMEGLVLRGQRPADQLAFDLGLEQRRDDLHRAWESAAERERRSQTKYAHEGVHPEEVAREVAASRQAMGTRQEVAEFTVEALRALGASVTRRGPSWEVVTSTLPVGLRDALPPGHAEPLPLHPDLPVPRGHGLLARTDPHVEAVARHVLDTALDAGVPPAHGQAWGRGPHALEEGGVGAPPGEPAEGRPASIAARAGVGRTRAVSQRTTLVLVRFRFHLDLPGRDGTRSLVTEDARFLAFAGPPDAAAWLGPADVDALLGATADANVAPDHAADLLARLTTSLPSLSPALDAEADRLATELLDAHRRVRAAAGAARRGLAVAAQKPADVLGLYVWLPVTAAGPR
ncbi:MAG: helicase-related protein [Actinomycetota bacterium]